MTTEREYDYLKSIASATEFTGMLPAIENEGDPDTLAAVTDVPVPVITMEDPGHSPLMGGSVHPYDGHSQRKTRPADCPAKEPGPYRRD